MIDVKKHRKAFEALSLSLYGKKEEITDEEKAHFLVYITRYVEASRKYNAGEITAFGYNHIMKFGRTIPWEN